MVVGVGLPRWCSSIESACQCKRHGLRRSPGEGSSNPFPCLENPINRQAWLATVRCIVRVGYDRAAEHARMQFISVQSLSHVRFFATPWTAARQASLSITNSRSLLKLMSTESVMPSNHLIPCRPLLLLSLFPSIRVFSNESVLRIRWPKYWSFSFNISPSNEHPGLISLRMDWLDLLAVQGTLRVFSNTTVQKHQYFGTQLSL